MLAVPISARVAAMAALLAVGIALAFATTATYARKETVPGWITPAAGLIRLESVSGGRLERLSVSEGATLPAGGPVAHILVGQSTSRGEIGARLSTGLEAEGAALQAQAVMTKQRLEQELQLARLKMSALARERSQTIARLEAQRERVRIAKAEVERSETLAKQGFLAPRELANRHSGALALEDHAYELAARISSMEREIAEAEARAAIIPLEISGLKASHAHGLAGLQQRQVDVDARAAEHLRAPVASRVLALPFTVGQSVRPGAAVAILSPLGSALEAELYIPSRSIGFVEPGQEVRLMYAAFPHQKFGTAKGTIRSVSKTVVGASDVAVPGLSITEPVFKAKVRLDAQVLRAYGRPHAVQPGMLLAADLVLDKRSLLEWLLDPLYAAGRRS